MLLRFALLELLLVAVGIEVAGRVGRMDFVDEVHLAVLLAELILRVDQDEALLGCHPAASLEEGVGVFLHQFIVLLAHQTLSDDFLFRDVLVVSGFSLGRRGDDGGGELLVFLHSVGESHAAERTAASLVLSPGTAGEIAADNHFHAEAFTLQSDGHHGVGSGNLPVGDNVSSSIQELGCNLVQHLSLEGDAFRQDDIEGRDAVGGNHDQQVVVDVVHIAYLSMINTLLTGKVEVCFY